MLNTDQYYNPPTDEDFRNWGMFLTHDKIRFSNDQSSVTDQLRDLYFIAKKIGKYDAAEYLERELNKKG